MTDKNIGKTPFKDEWSKFESLLDEYESQKGIMNIQQNIEVAPILSMTISEMSGMTALQCGEAAFLLFQYATYIQKEQNRENVKKNWAESKLNKLMAKYGEQYGDKYTKYEMLKSKLIVDNSAAQILDKVILHATSRSLELEQLSNKISSMGRSLLEYQNVKSRGNI